MRSANVIPAAPVLPTPRVTTLPTYVFAWLDELKAAARARGAELLDLGIGNPDQPTPPVVVEEIARAWRDPRNHGYPPFRGTERFRGAVADFMARRYGVEVDAAREVLCVSGGKEGIAHLTIAYADEGSLSLVGDIHYPVHSRATLMAGSGVHQLPLRPERGYLPDFDAIPADVLRRARLLFVNYPHNPTGAVAPLGFYEDAVELCARHGMLLVSDMAYGEITFDGRVAPSVLEVPGAKEVAVELHSLSKSFNMAGSRIGFAVGNAAALDALYAVRMNMGYGSPAAVQAGGALALDHAEQLAGEVRSRYESRRDVVVEGFRALGWTVEPPGGTMFAWLRVPRGFTSQQWTEHLIETAGVVVTPGNAFGPGGEGFFRISLVADEHVLREALARLGARDIRWREQ